MFNRFRIDVRVLGETSELGLFSLFGPTLEDAMATMMTILTPHIANGAMVQVLNTSVWCEACGFYESCTEQLLEEKEDGEPPWRTQAPPSSPLSN